MKNLENYGVVSLDCREMKETDGGCLGLGLALGVIGACIYVYNGWDDFAAGFSEGYASTQ